MCGWYFSVRVYEYVFVYEDLCVAEMGLLLKQECCDFIAEKIRERFAAFVWDWG